MNVSCECQNVVFKTPLAKPRPTASGHTCGTRLIHSTPGKSVVSVKGGCIEGLDWKIAKHIWVKRAMVPIPEGAEISEEEPDHESYICGTTDILESGKMDASAA
ncbi:hypothetical protein BOTCAL_0015g00290 [Botryotinia calthae]|uniref:CENP-V/GFA domain-containing protein n=1 Tax=Botryotinia calthae TaxID=38488 RepID=A0A4Y8DI74_9HELO|nr:hypothetical protein BOTCAL_0015g00290 [Botryotinia calthae]